MKAISFVKWGASGKILWNFYMAYVRAKLDYGSGLYCTAAATNLKKSDVIQNACCRLVLGARKFSPIPSLQAEAHLPSLEMHRGLLMAKTLIKLSYEPRNNSIVDDFPMEGNVYTENQFPINSFMRRALYCCRLFDMDIKRNTSRVLYGAPPWMDNRYLVKDYNKDVIYNNATFFYYVYGRFPTYNICFTDGSKAQSSASAMGSSVYFPKQKKCYSFKLHPEHSVLFSELYAIEKALEIIDQ